MSNDIPPGRAGATATAADAVAEQALLETFYACFAKRDYRGMCACYHPSVSFRDNIFKIEGKRVSAMWHMLCESGKDMTVAASGIKVENGHGRARWVAAYTFSATGRKVVNVIDSRFEFKDGRIIAERDDFSFWKWSRQALGLTGLFLGWMPRVLQTVQEKARGNLDKFISTHPEYWD